MFKILYQYMIVCYATHNIKYIKTIKIHTISLRLKSKVELKFSIKFIFRLKVNDSDILYSTI